MPVDADLRCPGYLAGDPEDEPERHRDWRLRPTNPRHKRYWCQGCEAFYPYLADMAGPGVTRHAVSGPLGPVHPHDDTDYEHTPRQR